MCVCFGTVTGSDGEGPPFRRSGGRLGEFAVLGGRPAGRITRPRAGGMRHFSRGGLRGRGCWRQSRSPRRSLRRPGRRVGEAHLTPAVARGEASAWTGMRPSACWMIGETRATSPPPPCTSPGTHAPTTWEKRNLNLTSRFLIIKRRPSLYPTGGVETSYKTAPTRKRLTTRAHSRLVFGFF